MDPVLRAVLTSWQWRADVIMVLLLAGTLFVRGWVQLHRRSQHLARPWRLVAYLSGLLVIALALMSPIDTLVQQLFFVHMIQHLLLIMVAPPLLLIVNPLPFTLWGLPDRWRHRVGGWLGRALHRNGRFRPQLRSATAPGTVWLFSVISILLWHDPNAYNAALRHNLIHDAEHLMFFAAGMAFWWRITGAGPRIYKQSGLVGRIIFVLAAVPPNMALGATLAFIDAPVYTYYTAVPRLWGLSALTDQRIGGLIMWIPGSMMYIIAALILSGRILGREEAKPPLPESAWATEQALAAPGRKPKS